jgi:hypothetical protein
MGWVIGIGIGILIVVVVLVTLWSFLAMAGRNEATWPVDLPKPAIAEPKQ